MEKNYMLTKSAVAKERFNAEYFAIEPGFSLEIKNKFINYYMQLIQFAYELDLIPEEARGHIAQALMSAIEKREQGRVLIATNYLYVVTLWLQSMSNWDAWLKLSSLKGSSEANTFLDSATSWFKGEVSSLLADLSAIKKAVFALGDNSLKNNYLLLEKEVEAARDLTADLKNLHCADTGFLAYGLLKPVKSTNYLDGLKQAVAAFVTEISILTKCDIKNVIRQKKKEVATAKAELESQTVALNEDYAKALKELEAKKSEKLDHAAIVRAEYQEKCDTLEQNIAEENPELDEDELAELYEEHYNLLFDEYIGPLPEEPSDIESWYENEKYQLDLKFKKLENSLEQDASNATLPSSECSLRDICKEYALFALASRQLMVYPDTPEARAKALEDISDETAISEFFNSPMATKLSKSDLEYLKSCLPLTHKSEGYQKLIIDM